METGYFYFIKETYYIDYPDPKLMKHTENGFGRPFYYVLQDRDYAGIFWLIPISRAENKSDKYQKIIQKKKEKYGRCDTIVLGEVLGVKAAFLIQNMCPVTEGYIANQYIQRSTDLPVRIAGDQEKKVCSAALRVLTRVKQGDTFFIFPDVMTIYNDLKNKL